MNERRIADISALLGPIKNARVVEHLPDHLYHGAPALSSSALKEYGQDPMLFMKQRVLGTAPKKEDSAVKKSNFRVGRAVHCFTFEGEEETVRRYPIYTGATKSGEGWKAFLKECEKDGVQKEDILNKDEGKTMAAMGLVCSRGRTDYEANLAGQNHAVQKMFPELSLFAEYENGFKLKVRFDALYRVKAGEESYFRILDLKTTGVSAFDASGLADAIQQYGYALSAALYVAVLNDALSLERVREELAGGQALPQRPFVVFDLLFGSKLSRSCAALLDFVSLNPVDGGEGRPSWTHLGCVSTESALISYEAGARAGESEIVTNPDRERLGSGIVIYNAKTVHPTHRARWLFQSHEERAGKRQGVPLQPVPMESDLRSRLDDRFKPFPPAPKPQAAAPKPKPKLKLVTLPSLDAPEQAPVEMVTDMDELLPTTEEGKAFKEKYVDNIPEKPRSRMVNAHLENKEGGLTGADVERMKKKELRAHPQLAPFLEQIDWKKNIRQVKSQIRGILNLPQNLRRKK